MFVDSHCHLSFPELAAEIDAVLERMRLAQVGEALNICVRMEEFAQVLELAHARPNVFATVGVHPDTRESIEPTVADLVRCARDAKILAIGETGLDYFRLQEPLQWQRERFRVHIRAARECGKPLVVHSRAAPDDTLQLLREEHAAEVGGVMHCFTESVDFARAALELGFYISFSGIVTFRNATELQKLVPHVPPDRLLIETDSPYLSPVPYRGKVNEPARVVEVARKLAELTGRSLEEIGRITTGNFRRLFRGNTVEPLPRDS